MNSMKTEELSSKQRILERAIEVINEAGEAAIRTNPIAAECGVTPPILYRAYQSREGLVIAAQAERYRRATTLAVENLVKMVLEATSREDLYRRISESLDYIYNPERSTARAIRASVIGSAISRPELQKAITEVDLDYMRQIAGAYDHARAQGWINDNVDLPTIALWAQSIANSRIIVEFADRPELSAAWNNLSKRAILDAIFG